MLIAQTTETLADRALVQWAIVAISIMITIALIGLTVVSYVSFNKDNKVASEYMTRVFVGGAALRLLTVLAVILSATILSLAGQLKEGTIALLSGIAGYVLGGISAEAQGDKKANPEDKPPAGT
jgi:hypothetical protein